ncbi:MAG: T9SS type A sorting domain-containing protein [Candidatus Eisenbacteria bacterium]
MRLLTVAATILRGAAVLGCGVALLACIATESRAQTVDTTLWCSHGVPNAIARQGDTIYLGGSFYDLGPATGCAVPVDVRSGSALARYPKVTGGQVNSVVADGQGGWYVGGLFSAVGGIPRRNLAHIMADGDVDDWAPDPDSQVRALALVGSVLYVGGDFTTIGDQPHSHLAALSTDSDHPLPWNPSTNDIVETLIVRWPVVYVGGSFTEINGQPRAFLGAIDAALGRLIDWHPDVTSYVQSLALDDTTLYVGGDFYHFGGIGHRYLGAVSTRTGELLDWDPRIARSPDNPYDGGPRVLAILVTDSLLYVAGAFNEVGGQSREGLVALDKRSAAVASWDPHTHYDIPQGATYRALAMAGDTLFAAGQADSVAGTASSYVVALSAKTATRYAWDPRPNWPVYALGLQEDELYVGGVFSSIGPWTKRRCLAAIDATTGKPTDWAPEADNAVWDILPSGNTIYVGGWFTSIGGVARNGLAAIDATTGKVTDWDPQLSLTDPGGGVYSIAKWKNTILAGGSFSAAAGEPRANLAAIDSETALPTAWNPGANDRVYTVVPGDSVIYVGGWFTAVGGTTRHTLAALDPDTGTPTPWAPGTDNFVDAIVLAGGNIYVAGWFDSVSGVARKKLAAIDRSGTVLDWVADTDETVLRLAVEGSTLYAGGFFTRVGGESRRGIAALDLRTGTVLPWNAAVDSVAPYELTPIRSIVPHGDIVYVGGLFGGIRNQPQAGFAAVSSPSAPPPTRVPATLELAQSWPNPTASLTTIRYSLPEPSAVTVTVFDLQGRRVASLLAGTHQTAGPHQVTLRTDGWPSGCYLYRVEAGALSATRKLVVVR